MKKILFISMLFLLFACKNKKPVSALQFSNDIVKLEQSLAEPIFKTEAEIKRYGDSANYNAIAISAGEMENKVQQKIDTLELMDAAGFKGGEDFKMTATRYFEYVKSLYTAYKDIGNAKDDSARQKAATTMNTILNAQADIIVNMRKAQDKFANENGFQIEPMVKP